MPTWEQINESLRAVVDPELHKDIVSLGMVRSIEQPARSGGRGRSLTTAGCPIRSHFETAVKQSVMALDGVQQVSVGFDVLSPEEKQTLQQRLGRKDGLPEGALPPSRT